MNQAHFTIPTFHGLKSENATLWLKNVELYCSMQSLDDDRQLPTIILHLRDGARRWYDNLEPRVQHDLKLLKEQFLKSYQPSTFVDMRVNAQTNGETCEMFLNRVEKKYHYTNMDERVIMGLAIEGLLPNIKSHVVLQQPSTWQELKSACYLVESTIPTQPNVSMVTQDINKDIIGAIAEGVAKKLKHENEQFTHHPTQYYEQSDQVQVPDNHYEVNYTSHQYRQPNRQVHDFTGHQGQHQTNFHLPPRQSNYHSRGNGYQQNSSHHQPHRHNNYQSRTSGYQTNSSYPCRYCGEYCSPIKPCEGPNYFCTHCKRPGHHINFCNNKKAGRRPFTRP
ncbi:uncharacterized protein LOC126825416 [Patella vulgata]|uniref:uncharacterized protein LOC126825416 n=1 Tax=Patella vulgata TaxID=6465 RepID=UPI00217F8853|nr:uncharacterized protein LOC126825416 [Patella vulgata]